jgi:hypothetical protein
MESAKNEFVAEREGIACSVLDEKMLLIDLGSIAYS